MKKRWHIYAISLILAVAVTATASYLAFGQKTDSKAKQASKDEKQMRSLTYTGQEWTGDFDKMLEMRRIRVLIPHSRTLYFNDKGRERGLTGENIRDFERWLNKKYARKLGKRPLTIFIVPETRDAMLNNVARGLGDIAAGNLTVTEERLKTVDFVAAENTARLSELLITGPKSPAIMTIDDLAGKTVHVRKASSYYESLTALNERFKKEDKIQVNIEIVPDPLEDEDLMEMLNAGLLEFLVVDDWKANMWAQILPKIKVRRDIVLHSGGRIGWAVRKDSPKLRAEIDDFFRNYVIKNHTAESRLAKYHKSIRQIKDPTASAEWKRFEQTLTLFSKYGDKYQFDPVMLAAQGYQESGLDQRKRGPSGAIGIMQIMPATGASLKVGNVRVTEPNIHGGAKYMDMLIQQYFPDRNFSEQDRTLFAFASYNAGPGRISRLRKIAEDRGLDPNKWFNNVEIITAEKVGLETTTYVRNIYKYYVAYKMTMKAVEEKRKARDKLENAKKQ